MKQGKLSLKDLAPILDGSWSHHEIILGISKTEEYKNALKSGIQILTDDKLREIVKENLAFLSIEQISEVLMENGLPVKPATISYYIKSKCAPDKVTFSVDDLDVVIDRRFVDGFESTKKTNNEKKAKGATASYYPKHVVYYINFIRLALQVGKERFNEMYKESFILSPGRWLNDLIEIEQDTLYPLLEGLGFDDGLDIDIVDSPLYLHRTFIEWLKPHVETLCKDNKEKFDHYRHKFEEIENLQDLLLNRVKGLKKDLSLECPPNLALEDGEASGAGVRPGI